MEPNGVECIAGVIRIRSDLWVLRIYALQVDKLPLGGPRTSSHFIPYPNRAYFAYVNLEEIVSFTLRTYCEDALNHVCAGSVASPLNHGKGPVRSKGGVGKGEAFLP